MNKKGKNHKTEFIKTVRSLNKRDDALSRAIVGLDKKMEENFKSTNYHVNSLENHVNSLENRIDSLEKRMDERFDRLESHIDAFMGRTETNEREVQFLGKQHDDLAGYCTKKIGYPVYGRNL